MNKGTCIVPFSLVQFTISTQIKDYIMTPYESILKFKSLAIIGATDSEKQNGIFKNGVHLRYVPLDKSHFDKDSDFSNFDYFVSDAPNDVNADNQEEIYWDE